MTATGKWTWFDLMTTDLDGAVDFYTAVVGWTTTHWEELDYTMWSVGEVNVGGLGPLDEEARAQGAPCHWMGHVVVDDLESSSQKATELGATMLVPPTPIPGVGRFSVIADPQGAVLSLFQETGDNTEQWALPSPMEPGAISWHELWTTDLDGAFAFYEELFGWKKTQSIEMGPSPIRYDLFGLGGESQGGIGQDPNAQNSFWQFYFTVADLDEALETVKARGGKVLHGPHEVPGGTRAAQCQDPQGAPFGLTGS